MRLFGPTPLMLAAQWGHTAVAEALPMSTQQLVVASDTTVRGSQERT